MPVVSARAGRFSSSSPGIVASASSALAESGSCLLPSGSVRLSVITSGEGVSLSFVEISLGYWCFGLWSRLANWSSSNLAASGVSLRTGPGTCLTEAALENGSGGFPIGSFCQSWTELQALVSEKDSLSPRATCKVRVKNLRRCIVCGVDVERPWRVSIELQQFRHFYLKHMPDAWSIYIQARCAVAGSNACQIPEAVWCVTMSHTVSWEAGLSTETVPGSPKGPASGVETLSDDRFMNHN